MQAALVAVRALLEGWGELFDPVERGVLLDLLARIVEHERKRARPLRRVS